MSSYEYMKMMGFTIKFNGGNPCWVMNGRICRLLTKDELESSQKQKNFLDPKLYEHEEHNND